MTAVSSVASTTLRVGGLYATKLTSPFVDGRFRREFDKTLTGAADKIAGFNYGVFPVDLGWSGEYDVNTMRFGQGAAVLVDIYQMGGGGISPGQNPILATPEVNIPTSLPGVITTNSVNTLNATEYPNDKATENTDNQSGYYKSEREAGNIARQKLGSNPIYVGLNKWRSRDGVWQYRARPGDLSEKHVHLERLNPATGEVLYNLHLRWK